MQKTVLSVSVAVALALPGLALAQAAAPAAPAGPAAPTLDKVLEASGISMTGYVDAAYSHANRDIETGFSDRVLDSQNSSFVLHQVGLQIAKQPKEGFGGLVNVTTGKDAGVIHSTPANESTFDLTQAYLQYATGPLTVIGGKFTTLHGTEVIWSPSNANFSRSILFGAVPFTHTGVRATYAAMDTLSLIVGVNNGWDQLVDTNKGKTLELGITATPIKPLSLAASYYSGKELGTVVGADGNNVQGTRSSFNFVASYTIIDTLSIGIEYLNVKQKDAVSDGTGGTKDATYSGFAGYLSYTFIPKMKVSLRGESFSDKDGFHFGTANTKYKEGTVTLAYLAADNFEVRGEVRSDKADQPVFKDGVNMSKTLMTYAIQALYKF